MNPEDLSDRELDRIAYVYTHDRASLCPDCKGRRSRKDQCKTCNWTGVKPVKMNSKGTVPRYHVDGREAWSLFEEIPRHYSMRPDGSIAEDIHDGRNIRREPIVYPPKDPKRALLEFVAKLAMKEGVIDGEV